MRSSLLHPNGNLFISSTFAKYSCSFRSLSTVPARIIILTSGNIFRNLAFEACLYADTDRYNGNSSPTQTCNTVRAGDLLMWCSDPCVVIGRFQNPWKEASVSFLRQRRWPLARRYSGGGTVFHDRGNLNLSFIESRKNLSRRRCMEFLGNTVQSLLPNHIVEVGKRYDLWMSTSAEGLNSSDRDILKISGSSSKLGAKVAYHHCTLLCKSNLTSLSKALQPTFVNLETKATDSVRSRVVNLDIDVDLIKDSIIRAALNCNTKDDKSESDCKIIHVPEGSEVDFVDPDLFYRELSTLQSWSWIYGSSPAFELRLSGDHCESSVKTIVDDLQLNVDRGSVVKSISPMGNGHDLSSDLFLFVRALSDVLQGSECRTYNWHGILDRFCDSWRMKTYEGSTKYSEWTDEHAAIIQALRSISNSF